MILLLVPWKTLASKPRLLFAVNKPSLLLSVLEPCTQPGGSSR